jgi:serine/threonine protein kinase
LLIESSSHRLIVSDFGVAQVSKSHEKVKNRSAITVDAASFAYASPEVMKFFMDPPAMILDEMFEEWTQNPARDIFAFAIILWEMLARQNAWGGMSMKQIYAQVHDEGFRPPTLLETHRRHIVPEIMANSWFRYEAVLGRDRLCGLFDLLPLCWAHDHRQRARADVLLTMLRRLQNRQSE